MLDDADPGPLTKYAAADFLFVREEKCTMTQWDVRALETNFDGWRATRVPDLSIADAFERYAIEAVFKDAEYSDEEISSGLLGGGNDGGVDGAYLTINDKIIFGDTPVPENPLRATLWLIQAKNSNSYNEAPLVKFRTFVEDALDYNKPVDLLTAYSSRVKDFIEAFRDNLGEAIGSITEINVRFIYITKSDHSPSDGVLSKRNDLTPVVLRHLSAAKVSCDFWGARPLLDAKRAQPQRTYSLEVVNHFSHQGSFIGIARLDKFAHFLTDDAGNLRQNFLEPNVRDYAGRRNKVNEEIRKTLDAGVVEEFWWLNNGITILGEDCNFAGGKLNIKTPEIVNGLQTSTEIFSYFKDHSGDDSRLVLIRVILPPSDGVRRKIIKATNSQTPVNPLSLHANDDIHFDIEELFRVRDLFYDRRKGEHRRKMLPVDRIVSMTDIAQVVIAIALHAPDDARARPRKRLDTESGYVEVFDTAVSRNMFLNCVLIDRVVRAYLNTREDIPKDEKNDIRFYVDVWLSTELTKKKRPSKADIGALHASIMSSVSRQVLDACCASVRRLYVDHGADSRAAKGSAMRDAMFSKIAQTIEERDHVE